MGDGLFNPKQLGPTAGRIGGERLEQRRQITDANKAIGVEAPRGREGRTALHSFWGEACDEGGGESVEVFERILF